MILGVDPGGTTGVVILNPEPLEVIWHDQLAVKEDPLNEGEWARELKRIVPPVRAIAAERFVISPRTLRNTRQHDALDVLGALRYLSIIEGVELILQNASDAKTAFSDEVLKSLGLFDAVKGGHARDALRHALLGTRALYRTV